MERFHQFWEKAREVSVKQSEPLYTEYRAQNVQLGDGWFLKDFEEETLPDKGSWFSLKLISPSGENVTIFWDERIDKFKVRGPKQLVAYMREEETHNQAS